MNYEKKYKEALERAKVEQETFIKGGNISGKSAIEKIFPELRESEDERIRKSIVKMISDIDGGYPFEKYGIIKKKALAWLEKQGEQKSAEWDYPYGENETIDKLMAIAECLEMDEDFMYNGYTGTECVKFLRDLARKQVECKPVDKVEPKFKVGDWIVYSRKDSSREILYVYDIKDSRYYFNDNIHLSWSVKECDEKCHLWTIQDAKDGDVLAYVTDEKDLWIMIYKSLYEPYEGHVHYHALLANDDFSSKGTCCICIDDLKPATKEQCDLLFQKMHEAGYEWNAEKKALKKIDQKPAWSEEDNEKLDSIIEILPDDSLLVSWLKSLKDRAQPQQNSTWSEEDEKMLASFLHKVEVCDLLSNKESAWILKKLKSIKPRPHWKPSKE